MFYIILVGACAVAHVEQKGIGEQRGIGKRGGVGIVVKLETLKAKVLGLRPDSSIPPKWHMFLHLRKVG